MSIYSTDYNISPNLEERCDRFRLPDRFYGCELKIKAIGESLGSLTQHPEKRLLLVSGPSGIGKTAVLEQVSALLTGLNRITFIRGKFDQLNRHLPLSGILQAFRDLIAQRFMGPDRSLIDWKKKLLDALGDEAQILLDILPELSTIIGPQPPVVYLVGEALGRRFNLVLLRFIRVLANREHPLVLFLDDVQWADRASLEMIQRWMTDRQLQYFSCVVAYRDQEISLEHPLTDMLERLRSEPLVIQDFQIAPLPQSAINQMLSDTLNCPEEISLPLSAEIWEKTQGNPFFSIQLFKAFYDDDYLRYDFKDQCWQCDLSQIRSTQVSDDVVDFMVHRLKRLSLPTRSILMLATCIGNTFDLDLLATIADQTELTIASKLWRALQEGLVIPTSQIYKFHSVQSPLVETHSSFQKTSGTVFGSIFGAAFESVTYCFLHDRVQQAAYALIPMADRATMHLRIARRLQVKYQIKFNANTLSDRELFDWVGQANQGLSALKNTAENTAEKNSIAELNRMATQRAMNATAYQSALDFATIGLSLLPNDRWKTHEVLTRSLTQFAAESAYLSGHFDQTPEFVESLYNQTRSVFDRVNAQEIQFRAYAAEGKPQLALKTALSALKLLGFDFPLKPKKWQVALALLRVRWMLHSRSPETFLTLPRMRDKRAITASRIIQMASYLILAASPQLFPILTATTLRLSLEFGNSEDSVYAYGSTAILLCEVWQKIDQGHAMGQMALKLLEQYPSSPIEVRVKFGLIAYVNHWKLPIHDIIQSVEPLYQRAIEFSDPEMACWAIQHHATNLHIAGTNLAVMEQHFSGFKQSLQSWNQVAALRFFHLNQHDLTRLRGTEAQPFQKDGQPYDWDQHLRLAQAENSCTELFFLHASRGWGCYLFGDYQQAYHSIQDAYPYRNSAIGLMGFSLYNFIHGLIAAAYHDLAPLSQRKALRQQIRKSQRHLDRLRQQSPKHYTNKYYLVKAEYARIKNRQAIAVNAYHNAISLAHQNRLTHEAALAYELTARFHRQYQQNEISQRYLQKSYDTYQSWGATAKLEHLKRTYTTYTF